MNLQNEPITISISKLNLNPPSNVKSKAQELFRIANSKSVLRREVVALPFACLHLACEV